VHGRWLVGWSIGWSGKVATVTITRFRGGLLDAPHAVHGNLVPSFTQLSTGVGQTTPHTSRKRSGRTTQLSRRGQRARARGGRYRFHPTLLLPSRVLLMATNLRILFHLDREFPVPLTGLMSTSSRRPGPLALPLPRPSLPPLRLALIAVAHVLAVSASDASQV